MKKFLLAFLLSFFVLSYTAWSQNVGINADGSTPATSAGLDVDFADKGLLIPRVALTATNDATTIENPATSLLVYNTTNDANITSGFYYWNGTLWVKIANSSDISNFATSSDLNTTNTNVSNLQTGITNLETDISNIETSVSTLETNVSTLETDVTAANDAAANAQATADAAVPTNTTTNWDKDASNDVITTDNQNVSGVKTFTDGVAINNTGTTSDNRAILDVKSTNKGVLLPRLSDTERNALSIDNPDGMLIFNTTNNEFQVFINNGWYPLLMGTFIPAPTPPSATTNSASNITHQTAKLKGTVNANNASTTVTFEYGTTTAYGNEITATQSPIIGGSNTTVTADISSLNANTTYHYRVKASNTVGVIHGEDMTFTTISSIIDGDGNSYTSVIIGTQEWLVENLNATTYNDGTPILNVTDDIEWDGLTNPAYCWYGNDINNKNPYGALYNWYVVDPVSNGGYNVCPIGWHVPTDSEWTTLTNYLGGTSEAGGKMKETGTMHWISPNEGATNSSGFTSLPSGYRYPDGSFHDQGYDGPYWSSTPYDALFAWYLGTYSDFVYTFRNNFYKKGGMSIRCIKD